MNERIRELLKQASKLANTDENKDIDRNFDMIVAEKFAELIVREFGVALSPMLHDMISRGQAYDLIKQHFGVEE